MAPGMAPKSGHLSSMSLDFEEDEWVTPADWQAGVVASATPSGLAASVFVPSVPLSDDEEDEEEEEEDPDAADDSNLEEIGDSDGLGDTDVETDGEWAGSSSWSFPAASVAEALTLVTSRPPSLVASRPPSLVPSKPPSEAEEASVRSSLFIDVTMAPPKRPPHRCGAPSFEISAPMGQDGPSESTWKRAESDRMPRLPMVFDISALNEEGDEEPEPCAAASSHSVPEDRERRLLCDVLWASQPEWGPADLVAAERKLAKAGVDSVAGLVAVLCNDLDRHLAQVGNGKRGTFNLKAFKTPQEVRAGAVWGHSGKGRGMEGPRLEQGRLLCDVLWQSRPTWTPAMLAAAQRKLAMVGIHDLASLDRALSGGLNRRLRKAGLKTFSADTIVALRRHMDAFFDRLGIEDKETAWMSSSIRGTSEAVLHEAWSELPLREVLWESRPMWSALDLSAAERKLALIGINSVTSLAGALAGDLNKQLRAAGLKAFNRETVRELRRRLGVPPSARRGAVKSMTPK
mmetsp:Transcript_124220/g.362598  ORF Transcript_124220/g.362598 Transcript_124220/m.362598 type:complete len:516 (-) Transcript_124220:153-1700(-)